MQDRTTAIIVGKAIAAKRAQRGLTQEALAGKAGITPESLARMEKGVLAPRFKRLEDFAESLDCSVAELFIDPNAEAQALAAVMSELLVTLTPEKRAAVLAIVQEMVRVMR